MLQSEQPFQNHDGPIDRYTVLKMQPTSRLARSDQCTIEHRSMFFITGSEYRIMNLLVFALLSLHAGCMPMINDMLKWPNLPCLVYTRWLENASIIELIYYASCLALLIKPDVLLFQDGNRQRHMLRLPGIYHLRRVNIWLFPCSICQVSVLFLWLISGYEQKNNHHAKVLGHPELFILKPCETFWF